MTFVHIPKTGGTSVSQWLVENTDAFNVNRKHDPLHVLKEKYDNLGFTFCFVRNPWDRMVSYYYYYIQLAKTRIQQVQEYEGNHPKIHKLKWTVEYNKQVLETMEDSFTDFIINKVNWGDAKNSQQIYHQGIDCIIKIEELEKEFVQIQERVNCFKPLPKSNATKHQHYSELYTDITKDLVYKHFESDVNFYNYEF